MNLVETIQKLQKTPLTPEQVTTMHELQKFYDINDSDPLIVVLALMAQSQLILESVPNQMKKMVAETIELHRTNLRDQSVHIAKDLILALTPQIESVNEDWKLRVGRYIGFFMGGMAVATGCIWLAKYSFF